MKNIINNKWKALMLFIIITVLYSCSKEKLADLNKPWNGSPTASVAQLYGGFVSNMALTYGDNDVAYGWLYPITQQAAVFAHSDWPLSVAAGDNWNNYYHNLSNYNAMLNAIAASPDKDNYKNIMLMTTVLKAYQTIKTTNYFGDMPYSQAGLIINNSNGTKPVYDTQQSIYLACLKDLQTAVSGLDPNDAKQISLGANDFILQNNIANWIKFANSLRLRIAVTMYDKDPTDAAPQIVAALAVQNGFLDDGQNVGMDPANIPNIDFSYRSMSFEFHVRMGSTMWNMMSSTNDQSGAGIFDPRCSIFFESNAANKWNPYPQNPTETTPAEGGDPYNQGNRKADWTNKNGTATLPNIYADINYYWGVDRSIPDLFLTAAQVHFLKAEVYARGMGTGANLATAKAEYEAGIKASVNFWTTEAINSPLWVVNKPSGLPNAATMNALLTNPVVAFDMANATHAVSQIYAQQWIDMYRQPWEAWTLMRRTGGLTPTSPDNTAYYANNYGIINRYNYPTSESLYNYNNWYAVTHGNDLTNTKMWIAK